MGRSIAPDVAQLLYFDVQIIPSQSEVDLKVNVLGRRLGGAFDGGRNGTRYFP